MSQQVDLSVEPSDSQSAQVVHARAGGMNAPVQDMVKELLNHQPQIVWREPVPTRDRIADPSFMGLWSPTLSDPSATLANCLDSSLDEARLYWPASDSVPPVVVHIVSQSYGSKNCVTSRWAMFWIDLPVAPEWLSNWVAPQGSQVQAAQWNCWSEPDQVLTLRDRRRYGLPREVIAEGCDKLNVTKYYCDQDLVLWRLERILAKQSPTIRGEKP